MQDRERKILLLTVSAHAMVHVFDGMVAPLVPLLVEVFDTNYFRIGLVVSLFSILFGAGSLPAGFMADRLGPRRLITVYLFGAGLSFVVVSVISSYWVYAGIMALAGLFCSTYHPAANTLIGKEIAARGNAFGIHGIAGSIGTAAAPVVVAWLGSRAGWRTPHLVFGVLAVLVAIYSLRIPVHSTVAEAERPRVKLAATRAPMLSLVAFYAAAAVLGLAYRATMTFLPAFMGERIVFAGIDALTAGGMMATLTLLSGAAGQYVGGRLVDRHAPEHLYLLALVVSSLFLVLMIVGGGLLLVAAAVVFALFYFSVQPIQNDILARYIPPHSLGAGYGLHFLLVFGAGSFGGAGAGFVADRLGLTAVFVTTAALFGISTLLIVLLVANRSRVDANTA